MLTSTSASTAPKRPSMMLILSTPCSMQPVGERDPAGSFRRFRRDHQIDEVRALRNDDQRRRNRNHRLHDGNRNPRQAHERIGGEDRQDRCANAAQQHKEGDHDELRPDVDTSSRRPRKDVDQFGATDVRPPRSEEHTSELQSRRDLVCRLLLEKKKNITNIKLLLIEKKQKEISNG